MSDMHIHMYITMGSTLVSTHSLCLLLLHLILLELLVLILDTAFTDVHSCDAFSYCHLCEVQYVFEIVSNCNGSNFLSNAQNFGCFFNSVFSTHPSSQWPSMVCSAEKPSNGPLVVHWPVTTIIDWFAFSLFKYQGTAGDFYRRGLFTKSYLCCWE